MAFNIRDDQGFGIAQAIWAVQVGNFDLIILTDTNITNEAHCRNRLGYDVVCSLAITTAYDGAQGGLGLVVW